MSETQGFLLTINITASLIYVNWSLCMASCIMHCPSTWSTFV